MGTIISTKSDGSIFVKWPVLLNDDAVTIFKEEYEKYIVNTLGKKRVVVSVEEIKKIPDIILTKKVANIIKKHRDKVEKSACTVGNDNSKKIAVRIMLTFAGRSDIKVFNTYEEAHSYVIS